MNSECYVIMGAAVRPDGTPSGAMRRRVESALSLGGRSSESYYIVTGGRGKFGPPEAEVMESMLREAGVLANRIISDPKSYDTLSSVYECAALLGSRRYLHPIIICTDEYHVFRCRLLFRFLGIATEKRPMQSGKQANGVLRWTYYYAREALAILWDTFLLTNRQFMNILLQVRSATRR
jgi:vancomycin permeability regulator SanA